MNRLYVSFVSSASLAGCAASTPTPEPELVAAPAHESSSPEEFAPEEVETVDVAELDQKTVCEQIKRPGSRIVVETRCYTPDARSNDAAVKEEVERVKEILRREQENLERQQRERELGQQRVVTQGR